jgi:peptidoglycan/xylan/chitin deacetylase (PgdA/CDA1 family)
MRLILALAGAALVSSCLPAVNTARNDGGPIVCLTFDDGYATVYSVGFRRMRETDTAFVATHFLPVSFIDKPGSVTLDELREMEAAGWETGGHGFEHANLSSLPADSVERQVRMNHDFLSRNGLHHETFAYASGNYTSAIASVVSKWFTNIRTARDVLYADGVNRRELGYFAVKGGHTADDLIARVERARSIGAPLVVIGFHVILPDSEPPVSWSYWCRESVFTGFLHYLKKQELRVMTIDRAMAVAADSK